MSSNPHFIAVALEAILEMASKDFQYACEDIRDGRACLGRYAHKDDCCLPCYSLIQLRTAADSWRRAADFSKHKEVSSLPVRMALSVAATAKEAPANDEEVSQ